MGKKKKKKRIDIEKYIGDYISESCPKCSGKTILKNEVGDKWCKCGYTNISVLDKSGVEMFKSRF